MTRLELTILALAAIGIGFFICAILLALEAS